MSSQRRFLWKMAGVGLNSHRSWVHATLLPALTADPARLAVLVLLAAACVARGTGIARVLSQPTSAQSHKSSPAPFGQLNAGPREQAVNRILNAHLFGAADALPVAEQREQQLLAQWQLTGTFAASRGQSGRAILGPSAQATHLHAVGDDVIEGFRLTQVFADHVTIEHQGMLLTLKLPHTRSALAAGNARVVASAAAGAASGTPASHGRPPAMALLAPTPYMAGNGSYRGMRVNSRQSGIYQMGLMPRDVITQLDGHPINSIDSTIQVMNELGGGASVTATVMRDGVRLQIPLVLPSDSD